MSCPDCFSGDVTKKTPTGVETTIDGRPVYVASPAEGITPKAVIVFITDAFGWKFVNNRVLADRYAKEGQFLVYVPDFMNGNAMDPSVMTMIHDIKTPSSWLSTLFWKPMLIAQIARQAVPWKILCSPARTYPGVLSFVQGLRTSPPSPFSAQDLKIAAAGFCWGAKHAILLSHDDESSRVQSSSDKTSPLIDCAFTAHPSLVDMPVDIEKIKMPMSVAVGDKDFVMNAATAKQAKEILDAKDGNNHEFVILPGAEHGFAIRTQVDDAHQLECADKAEKQALAWFNRWLVSS